MTSLSALHVANASKRSSTAPKPDLTASDDISSQKGRGMPQFEAVLAQLKHENMASLVSSIRQGNENLENEKSSSRTTARWHNCEVSSELLYGSYNLAYRILFEDGVQWLLKVPANGHQACFDRLAAEALTSEALTMRMIKQRTYIPVPNVHHFDASADNDIGCPYIVMDFLRGKPLWKGWFNEQCPTSTREQFRARSLQTIAAAMVQLSQFKVDRGGSLQFDSDGRPVNVAAARVSDWLAEQDIMQGLTTAADGCLYCEKGPITDPASSFLFMFSRRGVREGDEPSVRGIHEIVRLFTEWTLGKTKDAHDSGPQFVLAHPDFAVQNLLVEDDGTLCGIIDWDGVAAVPLSVGCLKYPDWLMSDWSPEYNYCQGSAGQHVNSPEELATYRTMYAQFVEVISAIECQSGKMGKLYADITRRSLIAGSLDTGAHDLKLTKGMLGIIFDEIKNLTAEDDDGDVSDADLGSSSGTGTDDVKEGDSNGETAPTETGDSVRVDDEDNNAKHICSKRIAVLPLHQAPLRNVDVMLEGQNFPKMHATCCDDRTLKQKHSIQCNSNGILTKERGQEASASRTARVAKWALSLGEKGSKSIAEALHKKEKIKSKPPRKVRMVKWALGLGEQCCRGASEVLHKEESVSGPYPTDRSSLLPAQNRTESTLNTVNVVTGFCEQTETLQRNVPIRTHVDNAPGSEVSEIEKMKKTRVQAFLEWLIAALKKMIQKPIKDSMGGKLTSAAFERHPPSTFVNARAEHCRRYNTNEADQGNEEPTDGKESTEIGSEDIWASIAAEIDKSGIPIDLVKERRDVVMQCLIQTLDKEIQQKNETDSHSDNRTAAKEGDHVQKLSMTKNTNNASKPSSVHQPAMLESKLIKSDPKDAASPEHATASNGADLDAVGPNSNRSRNGGCRICDMAPKLKGLESASPESQNVGAVVAQFRAPKSEESAHDVAIFEATEEANRELRIVSSRFAKPEVPRAYSSPNQIRVVNENRVATEQGERTQAKMLENEHEAIESIDQNMRTMLSCLQEPQFVNENLQQNTLQLVEGDDGRYESRNRPLETVKSGWWYETAEGNLMPIKNGGSFKAGWWYETPEGSLRRIQNGESSSDGFYDKEPISNSKRSISADKGRSLITSSTSPDGVEAEKFSNPQLVAPNVRECAAINAFQVPDIDEDDEGYAIEGLEDGEIDQEASTSVDNESASEGEDSMSEQVGQAEVEKKPEVREITDLGHFTPFEVCVALGNGNLDEKRMRRLQKGFMALLDDAVGRYRR